MHQASFYIPDEEALFNLRAPSRSGPKAGVAPPSLAHPEFGSGTPSLPEPGIPNTRQRENYFCWVLHLPTDAGFVALVRDEVTRLSSWASWGLWRSHQCSDLPSRKVSEPPGRRGAAKLNLEHCFLPILLTKNIDVCLVNLLFLFFFFIFLILSVLLLHPRDHVAEWRQSWRAGRSAVWPSWLSAWHTMCHRACLGLSLGPLFCHTGNMTWINQMLSRVFFPFCHPTDFHFILLSWDLFHLRGQEVPGPVSVFESCKHIPRLA